ncbi:Putative short-chain dehydrogenase/reductase SDR, NAD(P)-binding domain superfamily [Septoria linicola]|uniref:Short-chain dehydrogenase/reductase SDR, NAD(P)-binding domain superfamily n=1 Tax=Septoria linicola TaxID=215465 RepID=A0A9Q9ARH0_9PEZI|nr:Putative short-chain dehydrogenase/reductase SDR, NAD(P)-binding domain superfamily [Septoria linicola]
MASEPPEIHVTRPSIVSAPLQIAKEVMEAASKPASIPEAVNPHAKFAQYPSLRGKTVLITGGAEGIGASAVSQFAHQGAQVLILDISETSAIKLIETLKSQGASPLPAFYHCDVTDLKALKSICTDVLKKYSHVDILVNNAASAGGDSRKGTFDVTEEIFQFNIDVNFRHQFFLTQYLAPSMKTAGGGSIINMGSITWRIPATGLPVYTACKAAVQGLTRTHARELGPNNIRVNSIMPGSIATERQIKEVLTEEYKQETLNAQAIKRVLGPDEVGRLILFLASDDASAITGSSYVCDGGWVGDP